jgi:hypothetical protein
MALMLHIHGAHTRTTTPGDRRAPSPHSIVHRGLAIPPPPLGWDSEPVDPPPTASDRLILAGMLALCLGVFGGIFALGVWHGSTPEPQPTRILARSATP